MLRLLDSAVANRICASHDKSDLTTFARACAMLALDALTDTDAVLACQARKLFESGKASDAERQSLAEIVSALDARAMDLFDASGGKSDPRYLAIFSLARAVNSVLCSFGADPQTAAAEAAYEAAASGVAEDLIASAADRLLGSEMERAVEKSVKP